MTRLEAIKHIIGFVDNAGSPEPFEITQDVTLVGFDLQGHDEPVFVACRSYMMDTAGNRDILTDEADLEALGIALLNEKYPCRFAAMRPEHIIIGTRGAPTTEEIIDVLSDLCEWEASIGFDATAPEWDRARDLFERLMDQRDAKGKE